MSEREKELLLNLLKEINERIHIAIGGQSLDYNNILIIENCIMEAIEIVEDNIQDK